MVSPSSSNYLALGMRSQDQSLGPAAKEAVSELVKLIFNNGGLACISIDKLFNDVSYDAHYKAKTVFELVENGFIHLTAKPGSKTFTASELVHQIVPTEKLIVFLQEESRQNSSRYLTGVRPNERALLDNLVPENLDEFIKERTTFAIINCFTRLTTLQLTSLSAVSGVSDKAKLLAFLKSQPAVFQIDEAFNQVKLLQREVPNNGLAESSNFQRNPRQANIGLDNLSIPSTGRLSPVSLARSRTKDPKNIGDHINAISTYLIQNPTEKFVCLANYPKALESVNISPELHIAWDKFKDIIRKKLTSGEQLPIKFGTISVSGFPCLKLN